MSNDSNIWRTAYHAAIERWEDEGGRVLAEEEEPGRARPDALASGQTMMFPNRQSPAPPTDDDHRPAPVDR